MDALVADLRLAARQIRREPGFALVVVLTLALGIGANTAIFALVDALLLRPLPLPAPDRLVAVFQTTREEPRRLVAPANFLDWCEQAGSFEGLSAWSVRRQTLVLGSEAVRVEAASVSANFFGVLGVGPSLGRGFSSPDDGELILSHALWRSRFGGEPDALGRSLVLDGRSLTVVGVLPASLVTPQAADVWMAAPRDVPTAGVPIPVDPRTLRDARYIRVLGRLRPGIPLAAARAEMDAIAISLARAHPDANRDNGIALVPLQQMLGARSRTTLLLLLGVFGLVLAVACANLAHLILARGLRRTREMAVRAALGAAPGRLLSQLLGETLLLTAAGLVAGLTLATGLAPALARLLGLEELPEAPSLLLFPFAAGLAGLTMLASGLLPARRLARTDAQLAFGSGERLSPAGRSSASALVVGQVAVAVVLVAGAAALTRTLAELNAAGPGFDPDGVVTAELSAPGSRPTTAAERRAFFEDAVARVAALPGVRHAAFTSGLPLTGSGASAGLRLAGHSVRRGDEPGACWRVVTPDYFRALGVPLLEGRHLGAADGPTSPPVAVVNRALARLVAPDGSALGRLIGTGLDGGPPTVAIVGVVADTPQERLGAPAWPEMYRPLAQPSRTSLESLRLVVRQDPALAGSVATSVRKALGAAASDAPLSSFSPAGALGARSIERERLAAGALAAGALLALGLASLGLAGVLTGFVTRGSRELGVRLALGATPAGIVRLVLGRGLSMVGAGLALGLLLALALGEAAPGLVYGARTAEPRVLAAVIAILLAVGLLASALPARRAAGVDAARALHAQ
ncbi:MAG: ADOP family duplicated permease [Vicinamibacteria bacterium]